MDSLLVILAVIGVVMILAGIARMKSRKKETWDDVDHSVLFAKEEGDAAVPAKPAAVDSGTEEEFQYLDNLLKDKDGDVVSSDMSVALDEDDRRKRESEEKKTSHKPRSLFDKLRVPLIDDDKDENGESLDPCYREGAPDKVIVLNVIAPQGKCFAGPALIEAITDSGLVFGDMNIFHFLKGGEPVFSLVNMVKPGVFDMAAVEPLTTPGVSLFIQLPNNAGNSVSAFDRMLETGRSLASRLGGELRDETRSVLTHSAIDHMREQLIEYDCKWLAHQPH